jgi:transcriptional regulator with XRE-family HTH domain
MNELEKVAPDPAIHRFVGASFDIADRIHEILEKRGISQKQLAEMLGKKESQVSKWMTGTHNFTIKTLALLEVKLGVSIFQVSSGVIEPLEKTMTGPVNVIA